MKVAILGGGPAGSFAAERLASAGVDTVLFDEKLAWEKPCGGGLTYKAYTQYPFLAENDTPKKIISRTVLAAPKSKPVTLCLDQPLLIYSRYDLNGLLIDRAQRAGAQVEKTRVLNIERSGQRWSLRTKSGIMDADYCLVATGARNPLRDFGTALTPGDTMSALGYYIPGARDRIDIQFLPKLEGYIWVFPRCGHLSVGICGKGQPASALRAKLERYMNDQGLSKDGASFYSHLLPCLETAAWQRNRVAGDHWAAVGDAAGLVDPITGEGLYYALRSADLATKAILSRIARFGRSRLSQTDPPRFRGGPGIRFPPCEPCFPRIISLRGRDQSHGAVYPTEPEIPRCYAGPFRRHPALRRIEASFDEKPERQPARDLM